MLDWLKVILLGIVQGITEYLPVSSTGHLIIVEEFLQLPAGIDGTFEVFIQIGSVVAVLFYYQASLLAQVRGFREQQVQRLWLGVLIAFIPAAFIGLIFGAYIQAVLFNPYVIALALIAGGVLFIIVETGRFGIVMAPPPEPVTETKMQKTIEISLRQALIVGCWQVLALVPGTSRSGMSIIGGMFAGLDRRTATQFSFYLAIPTLGAATLYTLARDLDTISMNGLTLLLAGAVVSGIVSWFAIDWLLKFISNNNFVPFGIYRILVGIVILIVVRL